MAPGPQQTCCIISRQLLDSTHVNRARRKSTHKVDFYEYYKPGLLFFNSIISVRNKRWIVIPAIYDANHCWDLKRILACSKFGDFRPHLGSCLANLITRKDRWRVCDIDLNLGWKQNIENGLLQRVARYLGCRLILLFPARVIDAHCYPNHLSKSASNSYTFLNMKSSWGGSYW